MTGRARILRGDEAGRAKAFGAAFDRAARPVATRILRERAEAQLDAARVLEAARAEAAAIVERARETARAEAAAAVEAARAESDARGAARWLAIVGHEQRRLDRDADRIVRIAVAMAERLLGASLELGPGVIATIARGVLAEARGARRALVEAHPADAAILRQELGERAPGAVDVDVRESAALGRGSLRLHTDVGVIDACVEARLDRLALALRDAFPEAETPEARGDAR
jgi:flagellar assembly protein FliH